MAKHPSDNPTLEDLDGLFTYHPPTPVSIPKYQAINDASKNLAKVILETCPPSRFRDQAIMYVTQVRMTANASIAVNPGAHVEQVITTESKSPD